MTAREIAHARPLHHQGVSGVLQIFAQKEFAYRKYKFRNRNPLLFVGHRRRRPEDRPAQGSGLQSRRLGRAGRQAPDRRRHGAAEPSRSARRKRKTLLDWGFNGFAPFKLFDAGETVGSARVWGGESFYVPLTGEGPDHGDPAARAGEPAAQGGDHLQRAAEAADQEGRPGGDAARHQPDQRRSTRCRSMRPRTSSRAASCAAASIRSRISRFGWVPL